MADLESSVRKTLITSAVSVEISTSSLKYPTRKCQNQGDLWALQPEFSIQRLVKEFREY